MSQAESTKILIPLDPPVAGDFMKSGVMKTLYSIGEFSQVTGLSFKTLQFYHERGADAQSGRSYAKILKRAEELKLKIALPTRGVYLKGSGMIFKGNPKNYLTEIQLPIAA